MFRFFENLLEPFPAEHPTQPPKGLWAFCRHYTRGVEVYLLFMALLSAILAIIEVALFAFLGNLVDWLATKNPSTFLAEEGGRLFWMGFIVLVGLPLTVLLHSMVIHQTLLGNYPMLIRWQAHRYLLSQSVSFYQSDFAGRIATKVLQTALAVRESVMKMLDVFLFVLIYCIGMLMLIVTTDIRLGIPLFVWLFVYVTSLVHFIPQLKKAAAVQADARAVMTGRIVDSYANISTVKLFSHDKRELAYTKEGMQQLLDAVHLQMRLVTKLQVVVWSLNALLFFSIAALSIYLWVHHQTPVGAVVIAISLVLRLNGMSQWIMWEVSGLFEHIGTVQDGMNTLSIHQEIQDKPNAKPLKITQGEIKFDRVAFHYGMGSGVIDDLSLVVNPGEKVGLVGRSGSGKSTLINLLLRFHDVEQGAITLDGQNVSQLQQSSLRSAIGVVTQDTSLLHRSVRENILYGRPDAREEELIAAATKAQAHEFIQGLEDNKGRKGYNAQVGERGVKLSGGQRQRIAIARVLLKDAPILVLDEATAALDSGVEAVIQQNLYQLMEGKTVIAIAHRLSTISMMDRLIVMDQGDIVEQGSHQQLVEKGGIYAQLWAHQSGGFLP
ncbi:multidrug ABC transporter ATP-binding protein [Candidatus Endobugula sertula]|uniref:Multidrug ABC transporter ATP-binding protein n=1 Tax=Candidatus Endobugula sertula TaxID=62101 RepID=A0A1D2QN67_9GAMM|nr:multidrug ABC transporter ATP-binding protein [Candidatus Endobugula sertula]